ncbi:MAG: hypothetical protein H7039_07280 [Bryobacteraceae bacterium]|nr:hypothetical protein [Bryobacteraceae bacterium]
MVQIRILSEHFRIDGGQLGFLYLPSLQPDPLKNPASSSSPADDVTFELAECVSTDLFRVDLKRDGLYLIQFGGCSMTHLPSSHQSQPSNVKRTDVLVTQDDLASCEMTLRIDNECLYQVVLFRNGIRAPDMRALMFQDELTVEVRSDESGSFTLLDDPKELFVSFDEDLMATISCWSRTGVYTQLLSMPSYSPLQGTAQPPVCDTKAVP